MTFLNSLILFIVVCFSALSAQADEFRRSLLIVNTPLDLAKPVYLYFYSAVPLSGLAVVVDGKIHSVTKQKDDPNPDFIALYRTTEKFVLGDLRVIEVHAQTEDERFNWIVGYEPAFEQSGAFKPLKFIQPIPKGELFIRRKILIEPTSAIFFHTLNGPFVDGEDFALKALGPKGLGPVVGTGDSLENLKLLPGNALHIRNHNWNGRYSPQGQNWVVIETVHGNGQITVLELHSNGSNRVIRKTLTLSEFSGSAIQYQGTATP